MGLIADYDLERREVAELVKVKRETVDNWLVSHESKHHEEVPDMAIELLEIKLAQREKNKPAGEAK